MWKKTDNYFIKYLSVLAGGLLLAAAVFFGHQFWKEAVQKKMINEHKKVNILVLGDSIWDLVRDQSGIEAVLKHDLGGKADIYNCSIRGSRAAAAGGIKGDGTPENNICLYAMAQYLTGARPCEIPEKYEAKKVMSAVDMKKIDYVIIAYGLNDYFGGIRLRDPDNFYNETTYEGAMCSAIEMIRSNYPNIKFLVLSPTYCQGYSYGQVVHESNSYSYGGGTCPDYVEAAREVAKSYSASFVDNTAALSISIHNGPEYLADATHLTAKGRKMYADHLADVIIHTYR